MNKIKLLKRNKKAETEKKEVIEKTVLKIPPWMVGASNWCIGLIRIRVGATFSFICNEFFSIEA